MNHIEAFENGEVLPNQAETSENQVGLGSLSCVYVHVCMVHVCVFVHDGSGMWDQEAAAEADTIREQQLKYCSHGAAAEQAKWASKVSRIYLCS